MRAQKKANVLPGTLAIIISLWGMPIFSQVTCVHPPPSGATDLFTAMVQKYIADFRPQNAEPARQPVIQTGANWRALVLLIDFPNYRWHASSDSNFVNPDSLYSPEHFRHMLFSEGLYADPFSASAYTGSFRDFYLDNSHGRFNIDGDVAGWFTAKHNVEYYVGGRSGLGSYPNNAQRVVEEAVIQADSIVDFSRYDNDGDGVVDALFIVHAGPGAEYLAGTNPSAAPRYIWSHFSGISTVHVDDVQVSGYAMMPEDGTIGVFCHEFGHGLGLPDLYDSDGSSEGVGEWCLMSSGSWCHKDGDRLGTSPSHFSAWSRLQLGWATSVAFQEGEIVRLKPTEISDDILILQNASMPATEYFLLENRQPLGFDAGLTRRQKDFGLPSPAGLMIYHIDEAGAPSFDRRRLVDVEEASAYFDGAESVEQLDRRREPPNHAFLNRGNRGDNGDPFPGFAGQTDDLRDFLGPRSRDRFDDFSLPSSRANSGAPTGIAISDIRLDSLEVLCRVHLQGTTSVTDDKPRVPRGIVLAASPNPAFDGFRLTGRLPAGSTTGVIRLFDVLGRELLSDDIRATQDGSFEWRARKRVMLPAGIYFAVVQSSTARAVTKIILLQTSH